MNWYCFKLNSGNTVVVKAAERKSAQKKFADDWPKNPTKVVESGDDDIPWHVEQAAIQVLHA
jgi:hypothetical protein